jgi:hypothetical protein
MIVAAMLSAALGRRSHVVKGAFSPIKEGEL